MRSSDVLHRATSWFSDLSNKIPTEKISEELSDISSKIPMDKIKKEFSDLSKEISDLPGKSKSQMDKLTKKLPKQMMKSRGGFFRGYVTPMVFDTLTLGYVITFGLTAWFFGRDLYRKNRAGASGRKIIPSEGAGVSGPFDSITLPIMVLYGLCMLINLKLWWSGSTKWMMHYNIGIVGNFLGVILGYAATYLLYETNIALNRPVKSGQQPRLKWHPALPLLMLNVALVLNMPYLGSLLALFLTAFVGFFRPAISSGFSSSNSASSSSASSSGPLSGGSAKASTKVA